MENKRSKLSIQMSPSLDQLTCSITFNQTLQSLPNGVCKWKCSIEWTSSLKEWMPTFNQPLPMTWVSLSLTLLKWKNQLDNLMILEVHTLIHMKIYTNNSLVWPKLSHILLRFHSSKLIHTNKDHGFSLHTENFSLHGYLQNSWLLKHKN